MIWLLKVMLIENDLFFTNSETVWIFPKERSHTIWLKYSMSSIFGVWRHRIRFGSVENRWYSGYRSMQIGILRLLAFWKSSTHLLSFSNLAQVCPISVSLVLQNRLRIHFHVPEIKILFLFRQHNYYSQE